MKRLPWILMVSVVVCLFFESTSDAAWFFSPKNTEKQESKTGESSQSTPPVSLAPASSASSSQAVSPMSALPAVQAPSGEAGEEPSEEAGAEESEGNGEELYTMESLTKVPKLPNMKEIRNAGKAPAMPGRTASAVVVPAAAEAPAAKASARTASGTSVAKIQEQIQEMLRVNEGLRVQYRDQAEDIRRIMDQARIHREILKGLEDNKGLSQKPVELLDAKEILRQEKIRLIREETAKNQAFLDNLQKERNESVTNTPPKPGLKKNAGEKETNLNQ